MIAERLTSKRAWENASQDLASEMGYSHIWKRLAAIEDILGDDYDLSRLRDMVEADLEWRHLERIPGISHDRLYLTIDAKPET